MRKQFKKETTLSFYVDGLMPLLTRSECILLFKTVLLNLKIFFMILIIATFFCAFPQKEHTKTIYLSLLVIHPPANDAQLVP